MEQQDYHERLAHDLALWQREGLISGEQEQAILARIGAGEPRLAGVLRMGWLVTAVSLIGAIVLGLGVILLFAANWQGMPDSLRVGIIFASIGASYALGCYMLERQLERVGAALLFLGVLLYHSGLFLLAQIYNMPVDSPILLLLAAVGTLPHAYLFGSRIVLLLGIADVTGWAIWELVARYEDSGKLEASLIVIGALGVMLYAVGRLHGLRRTLERFGDVYVLAGVLVTLGLVYVFSFDEPWDAIIDDGIESYAAPPIVYVSIVVAAVLTGAQWLLRRRDVETNIEAGFLAAVLAVSAVVATWPARTGYALLFNAVYFGAAGGFVVRGYMRGDERYINFGLALVALGVLTRYVDVFWSLLAGSAFYMAGGALLLGVAFGLERMRRAIVAGMGDGDAPAPPPMASEGRAS